MSEDTSVSRLKQLAKEARERGAHYEAVVAQAQASLDEARNDSSALSRALQLLGADDDDDMAQDKESDSLHSSNGSSTSRTANSRGSRRLNVAAEVREAVQHFDAEFDQYEIVEWIQEKHPSSEVRITTVSNALWRMDNNKQGIEKMRKDDVSGSNIYRKTKPQDSPQRSFTDESDGSYEETP